MAHDQSWDVDKYHTPHEPKHHWELKKRFIDANKDRYGEGLLVCLAQTFGNIEFMGCEYPEDTMTLIAEMSVGLSEEYRDGKKGKLQRTFISGSIAANNKVNRK
jgi:hypothetical protein